METGQVNPRGQKVTDAQLRADLLAGLKPADIARKHGVSKAAISKRLTRLELTTTTAAVAPLESQRFVSRSIDAIGQLVRGLERVNLLMDACDEWLRDGADGTRYDLSPRSNEIEVAYEVEVRTSNGSLVTQKRKKQLSELFIVLHDGYDEDGARFVGVKKGEYKQADPRELILKTAQEARQTVTAAADLARMLADAQAMQQWRQVVLDAVGRAAPEVREAIVREIQSSLVLRGLVEGPAATWHEVN